jgi:hypothetical protein
MQQHMDYFPTASDMQRRTQDLSKKRENTMRHLLQKCIRQIIRCADLEQTECVFEVPEVVLGLPTYDLGAAVAYLQDSLRAKGFQIAYIFPRVLIIGWRKQPLQLPKNPASTDRPPVSPATPPMIPLTRGTEAEQETPVGPPRPVSTSAIRPVEITLPFAAPYVRPIAELKPSGRFTLNLS